MIIKLSATKQTMRIRSKCVSSTAQLLVNLGHDRKWLLYYSQIKDDNVLRLTGKVKIWGNKKLWVELHGKNRKEESRGNNEGRRQGVCE